jgi:ATP-dependent exoDNAse (exonuclease V) beta subunit
MDDSHLIIGDRASYLRWLLGEFDKLEKYFGADEEGNIIYDENKDEKLVIKHMKSSHQYIGYEGFAELIDGKSKKDFEKELDSIINPKVKPNLIQPSDEQALIVKHVVKGDNVVVEAVAGSGKTTTVMFIAEAMGKGKVLQITYNKQLKFEVREKVVARKIKNLIINTYHSLAVRYYDENAHDDLKLKQIITNNIKPRYIDQFNVLIIDEKQDMTPDYYHFIHKFIRDMNFCGNVVLLGDRYQGVYEFKNADSRFLTMGSQLYGPTNFVSLSLQESFRVTTQIAWFVNYVMLGYKSII